MVIEAKAYFQFHNYNMTKCRSITNTLNLIGSWTDHMQLNKYMYIVTMTKENDTSTSVSFGQKISAFSRNSLSSGIAGAGFRIVLTEKKTTTWNQNHWFNKCQSQLWEKILYNQVSLLWPSV